MKSVHLVAASILAISTAWAVHAVAARSTTDQQSQPAVNSSADLASASAFAAFEGEWAIEATWDDGRPLRARNIYRWVLGGKHMKTGTFLPPPEGQREEIQRYDGMLTWHPGHKGLVCYSFAVDGGVSEYAVETTDGRTFKFGFSPWAGAEAKVRQVIAFQNRDAFSWQVEVKDESAAGGWKRIMNGVWRRMGS